MHPFQDLITNPATKVAVVGATDNLDKYGARIYRNLKRKGFRVFAVNPTRTTVDGDPAYATLADLPEVPDVINVVVPPEIGLDIARQAKELDYQRIWYQPGAGSSDIVDYLESAGFTYLNGPCIMVDTEGVTAD